MTVKRNQEAQRAANEALMSFALSLVTVGVAGGVAGAIARSVAKGKKVQEDMVKDAVKWSTQQGASAGIHWITGALSPDVAGDDVFSPAGMTPALYTSSLHKGITSNVWFLTRILHEANYDDDATTATVDDKKITLKSKSGGEITAAGAKQLTEAILDTSFMKEMPTTTLDEANVTRKAQLAMWMGWAQARDPKYWKSKDAIKDWDYVEYYVPGQGFYTGPIGWVGEHLDWEPVRKAIVDLGVPHRAVTIDVMSGLSGVPKYKVPLKQGLYMRGFMEWASSQDALAVLFDKSLPKNAKGSEMVKKRLPERKPTDNGWQGTSPFNPVMAPQ